MPVYHFTFHAYGTWLPDRPEGYFLHHKGWQPPSSACGQQYREKMNQAIKTFSSEIQQHLLDQLITASQHQRLDLYAAAIDSTHLHTAIAWRDSRSAVRIRSQIKYSLTRALINRYEKRQWLAHKAGQTCVNDERHLYRLVHEYLPKHPLYWRPNMTDQDKT